MDLRNTGVSSYDVSLEKQEVIVKGTVPYETVLEKIKKTGKEVRNRTSPPPIVTYKYAYPLIRPSSSLSTPLSPYSILSSFEFNEKFR